MQKALCFLCLLALSACAGGRLGPQSTVPATTSSVDRTTQTFASTVAWNVGAGASSNAYALQDLDFYPKAITIDAGDSITWHIASGVGGDAHTIAFLAPGQPVPSPGDPNDLSPAGGSSYDGSTYTNSGIKVGGQTYTLTFPKAGTYPYYCLFHEPAMVGTVVVQKAGTAYPHNAQYYTDVSSTDLWEDLGAADVSVRSFPFPVGGTTLAAGIDPGLTSRPPSDSTVLRYLDTNDPSKLATSGNLTIKVGTTLTWVNETSNEPHTVTFPPAGQHELPAMPPDPASGGNTFDGDHLVNSGTFLGGQKFSLKFTRAGSYFYGCLYHDNSRMTGTITVTP